MCLRYRGTDNCRHGHWSRAGIPKFYRWLSERYPLLNQKLTLTEGPPEMDNLYLDMNGIIHNCTHANRKDLGGVTEEDMMLKVFTYLEKLVQIVRPQKLLFMAIDGGYRPPPRKSLAPRRLRLLPVGSPSSDCPVTI